MLREERAVSTRTQIQSAAQRLQELGVVEKRSGSAERPATPVRVDSEARATSASKDRAYFRCEKKGYIAKHCTAPKPSRTAPTTKGKQ